MISLRNARRSLLESHPDVAAQAHGWDPTTVTAGSTKKLRWRCALGHEWDAVVYSRAGGSGCPACAGKAVVQGFNDLATTHPEFVSLAAFDPRTVTAGTGASMPWRCTKGHEWTAKVRDVTTGKGGCPVCLGRRVRPGVNDLATVNPALASEALFDPSTVTEFSNKKLPWRCSLGHEWITTPAHRSVGNGCPACGGKRVEPGFNDLATTHPEVAELWVAPTARSVQDR
jgi:hypothetical protein